MAPCFLPLAVIVSLLAAAGGASADGYDQATTTPPKETYTSLPAAPQAHGDRIKVKVEGMVYCQSCARRNTWSLDGGAAALPGAQVMVTCHDARNRVMAWRRSVADERGYFLAEFGAAVAADYYMGDPARACFARLLASPDRGCDELTNVNYGDQGAPLRDEGKRWRCADGYDNVVYAAGPLAFRPARCAPTRHY